MAELAGRRRRLKHATGGSGGRVKDLILRLQGLYCGRREGLYCGDCVGLVSRFSNHRGEGAAYILPEDKFYDRITDPQVD
jgi:hypothetical protein